MIECGNMGTLFFSFTVAIGIAVALVALSRVFGLDDYTSRVFPLIPILYAIIYNALDQDRTGRSRPTPPSQAREEMKAGARILFRNITASRVLEAVGISFAIKFSLEIALTAIFLFITGESFGSLYGSLSIETVGRLLRGEHAWLDGPESVSLLAVLSVLTGYGAGLWIGRTSRGNAMLEGVLAGAAVTFIMAMTNMLILYRRVEEAADQMAASLGFGIRIGFVSVLVLQVLLYGLWSGIAQKSREKQALRAVAGKQARKPRK